MGTVNPKLWAALAGCRIWPMLVFGRPGVGKTFAVERFLDYGCPEPSKMFSCTDILARYCGGEASAIKNTFREMPFVGLDEISLREPTGPQLAALHTLIEIRKDKPLILTSNLNPRELGLTLDARIASRICGTVMEITGPDQRLQAANSILIEL